MLRPHDERLKLVFLKENMVEFVDFEDFSENQKLVVQMKLDGASYEEIQKNYVDVFSKKIYPSTIATILKRSALGFRWEHGEEKGGQYPYLCPKDYEELKQRCELLCNEGDGAIDPNEFIDIVREIKVIRCTNAGKFLKAANCPKLYNELLQIETTEPTRSWINHVLEKAQMHFKKPIYIDEDRMDFCSLRRIMDFYSKYETLIKQCPLPLLFGADETMLDTTFRGKVLVSDANANGTVLRKSFKIPHITSLCCHSALGCAEGQCVCVCSTIHCFT